MVATTPQQPIRTPPAQRLEDFRRRTLPVLVWSLSAVLCAVLLYQRNANFEHFGVAQAIQYEVSANANGTLDRMAVRLFDNVEAGAIIARLDEGPVLASLETSRASIRQLMAELNSARLQARTDAANLIAELRRFQIDEEQRRLDALGLRVIIESDEVEAQRLALEVERMQTLLSNGLVGQNEYDNTRLQRDMVQRRIDENRTLLDQTTREWEVASARRQRYEADLPKDAAESSILQPLQEAISVAARRMEEIELQRKAMTLRSPVSGQVTQVLCRPGQAVIPGEPIATVVESTAREIIAYLNEAQIDVRDGTRVLLASRRVPGLTAESLVIREGRSIQPLPERLWRDPRVADYGRPVVIAGAPGLELTPGELVNVRFLAE